jgi:ribosomal protein L30/L7E
MLLRSTKSSHVLLRLHSFSSVTLSVVRVRGVVAIGLKVIYSLDSLGLRRVCTMSLLHNIIPTIISNLDGGLDRLAEGILLTGLEAVAGSNSGGGRGLLHVRGGVGLECTFSSHVAAVFGDGGSEAIAHTHADATTEDGDGARLVTKAAKSTEDSGAVGLGSVKFSLTSTSALAALEGNDVNRG